MVASSDVANTASFVFLVKQIVSFWTLYLWIGSLQLSSMFEYPKVPSSYHQLTHTDPEHDTAIMESFSDA